MTIASTFLSSEIKVISSDFGFTLTLFLTEESFAYHMGEVVQEKMRKSCSSKQLI